MPAPHDTLAVAGLRVLLLDDGQRRSPLIRLELLRLRCQLLDVLNSLDELPAALEQFTPDLLLIDSAAPGPALMAAVAQAQATRRRAVLLFAEETGPETMRHALQAGVSVVHVAGLQAARLAAVLQLTLTRFEQDERQRAELLNAQTRLAERKQIERARGILMREQGLDEDAAYHRLRRLAMDRGQPMVAVAGRLIDAESLLRPR